MAPSNLIVRTYKREDLSHLFELYNHASDRGPHFLRDKNFLEYFTHYPGVDEEGIFVAVENGEIVGLAIISVTVEGGSLRQGSIVELQAKDTSSMNALIQASVDYCSNKEVDVIVAASPFFPVKEKACKGWLKFETGVMMCKALSLPPLLQTLLDNEKIKTSYAGKTFVFSVGDEVIEVKITPGAIEFSDIDNEPEKTAILIAMLPQDLLKIVLGQLNPCVAYLTRRMRIKGIRNVPVVLKLFQEIKLPKSWSIALVDRM